jgi:hypothetical protein
MVALTDSLLFHQVYSLTSALAVATADDAFAVAGMLGVPHASFAVSPSKLDLFALHSSHKLFLK